ncbi:MAG: aldo/keto reductase [Rubinisphaera brasiliensis]|uniref:Aldo/keto reductase n=1 Tax=Rubinisphaera brasiliensis (strain ATCC 49424 / DSM 5305 / JCM 21570 / IAM 15109 / NBRC 103401 / IFAM 1448) TaxID=756272 RepID=F0SIL6_RUBBR|nr:MULTISPECIES: aldo/keto reductase [Rubinisphaera]ADY59644.1 aldo/keto reductase [Rubinisphaera brasiliensis DSM 5305]MBB02861.1 aldo/keto reductase [Planctomyces sp.]
MQTIPLAETGLEITPIGFGAFKIGRNEKIKYPTEYDLPDQAAVDRILHGVLDMGVNLIDTAPAYGLSEERIGKSISGRRADFVLSTKTGEFFEDGESEYDYSAAGTRLSLARSLKRLKTDYLDLVFVHSNGRDQYIQEQTDVVETLQELKKQGLIRAIGFSGKQIAGARTALDWADVIMVEYHMGDTSHADVIAEAARRGVGVIVKKGLASGHLAAPEAIRFVLGHPTVSSMVIGGLNLDHFQTNCNVASKLFESSAA